MQGGTGNIASIGFQAASAMFGAVAQSNAARGAEAVDLQNARQSELQGAYNVDAVLKRGRAIQGEAISALGAGGGVESGSAQDLIFQNSLNIEYAAISARYNAAQEARGYRFQAAQEKQNARAAIFGGVMRAGAAAITGISQARNKANEDAAYQARYDAYFPGGQQLPMPSSMSVDLPSTGPVHMDGGFFG